MVSHTLLTDKQSIPLDPNKVVAAMQEAGLDLWQDTNGNLHFVSEGYSGGVNLKPKWASRAEQEKAKAFKSFVHTTLDKAGVPTHPEGPRSKEGCRIGDRLDLVLKYYPGESKKNCPSVAMDNGQQNETAPDVAPLLSYDECYKALTAIATRLHGFGYYKIGAPLSTLPELINSLIKRILDYESEQAFFKADATKAGRVIRMLESVADPLTEEAVSKVRGARQHEYGDKLTNFTDIANVQNAVHGLTQEGILWHLPMRSAESVALDNICQKLARLRKSPDHYDTLVDIIGYVLCYRDIRKCRNGEHYTKEVRRFMVEQGRDVGPSQDCERE